ncbi:YHYH protein [Sanyastnella coralliicola]|uniref:YHYH protein n=1 Tax=Sanyastnella coralliicola TaxID=3069118 RepID=UPI0027B9E06A|nr:YHYH protein [Longitalea sp. SCSIO 12813]
MRLTLTIIALLGASFAYSQAEITSWILTDGSTGQYYNDNGNLIDSGVEVDIQLVQYSDDNVYVTCEGMPSYPIGPYPDGNPAQAGGHGYLFRIPRNPVQEEGNLTSPGLGHIGVLINGVPIYNAEDAMSYNNQGIWHQDAIYFENDGFDCSKGHPAPDMQDINNGYYHHHQNPVTFDSATDVISNICDDYPSDALYEMDPNTHSPLIGFAFDGFPIYGSFGYDDTEGQGAIVRIESSYQLRDITERTTLADGTTLNANQYGPAINNTFPLGAYIEDYEFVEGSGHLDIHNGRWCVTPEYPEGTYAYFATIGEDWNSAYPYFIGPTYYGEVATDNFAVMGPNGSPTDVDINEDVETWDGTISVAELTSFGVTIYPNPASTVVMIDSEAQFTSVRITDLQGRVVMSSGVLQQQFDVSVLPSGWYVVNLDMTNGAMISEKLLIRR